ncbi:MAG TPA: HD domain-containing phosphohydrolase [Vicinamibacterales bacterium]|nr:HD domain-containing phosphohydrolase [Vicinamibacterales bacterium]
MPDKVDLRLRGTDRVFPVVPGARVTAGRAPECEIHLEDPSVSRRHCAIEWRDGALHVTDLDSANGTFINEQIAHDGRLKAGDQLRLGASVLDVRDGSATGPMPDVRLAPDAGAGMSAVIQRRIEPSSVNWLAPSGAVDGELALLRQAQRHLSTLHRVSEVLAGARDLQALSDATLRAILEVLPADRTAIVLRRQDPETGGVEVIASRARTPAAEAFVVSRTLVSDVIARGLSVFAHDASHDARFAAGASVIGQHIRSVMCVPLRTAEEMLGALYVDTQQGAGRFTEADLELLAAIGNQAGVALHRVRLMGELQQLLLDTIRAIAATIDARDGYTHRHSERVAALVRRLGGELGLSAAEIETAELSALLHDVGKIAVPDSILNKPGRLTPDEFAAMQEHPVHGARILANIQSAAVKAVLPGVLHHHEKWDGTGYPHGLAGEKIPLLGRLLGVADVFDALTSARSYRAAMTPADAMAIVAQDAGRHFDPAVAAAAVRLFERGEFVAENPRPLAALGD